MSALVWLAQARQQAVKFSRNLAGLTACSQYVELENGERYVLRQQNSRATQYGICYQQEARLLSAISSLELGPVPFYSQPDFSFLHWIDGDSPTQWHRDLFIQLAELLAKLHYRDSQAVHLSSLFPTLDLAERCQFLWDQLPIEKQKQLDFTADFNAVSPFAQAICHHDIHLANMVIGQKGLFLIDWEYAALSDPALEIAIFFASHAFSDQVQHHFLHCYIESAKRYVTHGFDSQAFRQKIAEYMPEVMKLNQLWFSLAAC